MQFGLRIGVGRDRLRGLVGLAGDARATGAGRAGRQRPMTPPRTLVTPLSATSGRRPEPCLRFTDPDGAPGGDFAAGAVPNARLRGDTVPGRRSSWADIEEFALTYDGYAYWSDVAELGNRGMQRWARDRTVPSTLDELRGCLFYEQRRWHHFGEEPHGRGAEYVGALLDALRALVTAKGARRTAPSPRVAPDTPAPSHPVVATPAPSHPIVAASVPSAVVSFVQDDQGYLAWTAAHRDGFVLNAPKGASAKGFKLHKATCSSILAPAGSSRSLTTSYRKVCAPDVAILLEWCADGFAADPDPCLRCRP